MNHECLAELIGVSKRFGKIVALDGLDLQIRAGELFALLGQNGAGKTTAISLLLGLQPPDAGTAFLFGLSPLEIEARRNVGVLMQEAALVPFHVCASTTGNACRHLGCAVRDGAGGGANGQYASIAWCASTSRVTNARK
jgi:ABC-type multidrug transport system ATPase subunit